jgi:glycosyltransferase involved in cell wall biosynthesis
MLISVVIITFNSEFALEKVLTAVSWANEIIIVDSGSTDNTLEIARKFGINVIYHKFEGYGTQKHFACSLAKNDWVLSIDDDEVVTESLKKELETIDFLKTEYSGFKLPISLVFLGKLLKYGGEYKKLHLRFFNKNKGNWNQSGVHEGVELTGKIGQLNEQILHYSYANLHDYFAKFNNYTSIAAQSLFDQNKTVSSFKVLTRFPLSFLKNYLIKGSILDGYPGFLWTLLSAIYTVVKYAKLKELNRN